MLLVRLTMVPHLGWMASALAGAPAALTLGLVAATFACVLVAALVLTRCPRATA